LVVSVRALVTGSAGLVGRHMVAELLTRGYDVHSVDLEPMGVTWDQAGPVHMHLIDDCGQFFAEDHLVFDLVVHAAAVEPHRAAIDGMPNHLAANLHLDSAMFEWALRTEQRRVLYLSSSAAYPTWLQTGRPPHLLYEDGIDFGHLGVPDAGYGWLKLTGERMAADANRAGLPVHVVRPFSGYGEDQDERFPFGAFVARAKRREDPFAVWGDGSQVRDWLHVNDVVAGALAVVDADERRPVNLCTGVGTSMAELAELVCKRAGYSPEFEFHLDRPAGVAYRVGDPTRMLDLYQPKVSLIDGVERALTD